MPLKDKELRKKYQKEKYQRDKDRLWKNPDGGWKQPKNYGTDEYRKRKRDWYLKNRTKVNKQNREGRNKRHPAQYGKCEICNKECKLFQDHNHKTNILRGKICLNCNLVIGHAKENLVILQETINYLKHWNLTNIIE